MYEIGTQVIYHGSIERLNGEIFTVARHCCGGTRYALDGATPIYHVRHQSITEIRAPRVVLVEAIERQHPVEIAYTDRENEFTVRVIEPYAIHVANAGHEIVRCMDRRSGEPRTFRLARVFAARVEPGVFELDRPGEVRDPVNAILARIRAEIALVEPVGYERDAARWVPGDPIN